MIASHSQLRDWGIPSSEKIDKIAITFLSKAAIYAGVPAEPTAASSALTSPGPHSCRTSIGRRKSPQGPNNRLALQKTMSARTFSGGATLLGRSEPLLAMKLQIAGFDISRIGVSKIEARFGEMVRDTGFEPVTPTVSR
jgi:hypothetical protein